MGLATSDRSDSLSYGASSFVRVELPNGEPCPLRRGNVDVDFNNVVDDGGAEDDEVSYLIQKAAKFSTTKSPNDRMVLKR
jgi:hypothetical protein